MSAINIDISPTANYIQVGGPTAPSSLTATADGGKQRVNLSWTDNSSNEDGFYIERSPDDTNWTHLFSVAANVTAYEDTGLQSGTIYYYRVRAYNASGESANSSSANATTFAPDDISLTFWLDAGKGVKISGARAGQGEVVDEWEDQSGNSNDFTAPAVGNRPTLRIGAINGHSALEFDGSSDYLKNAASLTSTASGACFVVYRLSASPSDGQVIVATSDEADNDKFLYFFAYEDSVDPNIRIDQKDGSGDTIAAIRGDTDLIAEKVVIASFISDGSVYTENLNGGAESLTVVAGSNDGDWTADTSGRDNFTIGARQGSSVAQYFKGLVAEVIFVPSTMSGANITLMEEYLEDKYTATSRIELFLGSLQLADLGAASLSVNKPTKSGSNPLIETGTNNATWDYQKYYVTVYLIDGTYYAWYGSAEFDSPNGDYPARMTSADGITWSKPNLNLVTYDGDTDNNILLGTDDNFADLVYDTDGAADRRYVLLLQADDGTGGAYIYISADGINFTIEKTVAGAGREAFALVKRADGRWLVYYQDNVGGQDREIGAYLSDSDDLGGTWTDEGVLISTSDQDDQHYGIGVQRFGNTYMGFVINYNKTAETAHMDFYKSRDGLSWTSRSDEWLPLGSGGSWDDSLIFSGNRLLHTGNNWNFYYCGSPVTHDTARPKDMRVGLATIGYQRIGQIGTTGTVITREIIPESGMKLYINADASGGTLEVEIIDADDDSVVTNFAQADFDDITSDTYETEAQWSAASLPTGSPIKIKFILTTDVKLYAYEVR
jgi:hypothetical protein